MNSAESIQSLGKYLYLSHPYCQPRSMRALLPSLLHARAAESSTAITSVPAPLVLCSCCWVGWDQPRGHALPPVPLETCAFGFLAGNEGQHFLVSAEMLLLGAFTAVPALSAHH